MEARSLPQAFKSIMQARSWTQSQLGDAIGRGQGFVSRVVTGKQDPRLSTVMRALDHIGWEVLFVPKGEESDPVKRREFVTAAASIAFVPSPSVEPFQDPPYLNDVARRVERARFERGGVTGVRTAMRHLTRIRQVIDSPDRRLQAAASDLAASAVWTLNDAGRFDLGANVGGFALELARRSGDADAQARALSALIRVQTHRGDAGDAVRYALQGVRLRDVPDEQRDWLALRLAEALSRVPGHERAARDAVESLRVSLAEAPYRGVSPFEVAQQMGDVGQVLCELGAYQEARACLDEAMRGAAPISPLLCAYNLSRQATVELSAAQPAAAADRMLALARIAPVVESARLDTYLEKVVTLSGPVANVPEIREARRQLQSAMPAPPQSKG